MLKLSRTFAAVAVAGVMLAALAGQSSPVSAAPAGASTLRLSPAIYVGSASGPNFLVNVYANTQGQQMRAYEFGLNYDATKIDIVSIAEGPFMSGWATANGGSTTSATGGWNTSGNTGSIAPAGYAVAGAGSGGVVGEGIVAVITVQPLAATSGGSQLTFKPGAFLADENITPMTPLSTEETTLWLGEQPPMPDLVIDSLNLIVDPGDANKYKVEATVKNQGGAAAAASQLQVKVDGSVFETLNVGVLAIAGTETVTTVGQVTLTPESDNIDVCADSGAVLTESNEGNNCNATSYSLITDTAKVDTRVNAELRKYISLRAPADIQHENWLLKVGANTKTDAGTNGLGVKSNGFWNVTAADADTVNTNGKMRRYDGTTYPPAGSYLFDPHHVLSGPNDVTLPTAATLQSGGPNTTDDWQNFDVTFSQNVRFRDLALMDDWYHIVVTFSGSTSF